MESQITNEFPVTEQAVKAGDLMAQVISALSPYFKKIRVEFVTADNHSRLTRKNQMKQGGINSYNYVVGHFAKRALLHHKNIEFNIHEKISIVVEVAKMRFILTHGHTFSGGGGISAWPAYSIHRFMGKEALTRMRLPEDMHFDMLCIGHFHSPAFFDCVKVGGNLSGVNAYEHGKGLYSPPMQTAFCIHPKRGLFDWTRFRL